eukprot:TRINITY_DN463_c0_g1_i1.p1 TRINITY_DN463_c0_g1~~TRINITY_DN463_c0_g1_i1.p1  ORF type:complete len:174 (+),score=43.76 TRINITY_DN463_c0_g1_i1:81-524(+)
MAPKAMKVTKDTKVMKGMKAAKEMKAAKAAKPAKTAPTPMKAVVRTTANGKLSAAGAFATVAEQTGLTPRNVKGAIEGFVDIAVAQLKAAGKFNFAGNFMMKLKKKPAVPARKGVNPFTKEPCVFKAKPASQTVKAFASKKFKTMIS